MKKKLLLMLLFVFAIGILSACTDANNDDENDDEPSTYTVTFLGLNDEVLRTSTVEPGGSVNDPRRPWVQGYHFVGWDRDYTNVTTDIEVRAIFEEFDENTALHTKLKNIIYADSHTEFTRVYADSEFNRSILVEKENNHLYMELDNDVLVDPIILYMFVTEEEKYMMYELQEDEWIGDDYGKRAFESFVAQHSQRRQLPLGFFTSWFNVDGNQYTLKSEHFADLQAQIPMDGVFNRYVLTLNEDSLDLYVQIRMGQYTVEYYVTYSHIDSTVVDIDIDEPLTE